MGRAPPSEPTDAVRGGSSAQLTDAAPETPQQRYILPKNLRDAVKHLTDSELDLMHSATVEEMKRRGRTLKSVETDLPARPDLAKVQSPSSETAKFKGTEVSLTRGQVNAVRSAFKAGITPSRIAREFGISQSNVRKALASDETNR
jgi:hypothetical protein